MKMIVCLKSIRINKKDFSKDDNFSKKKHQNKVQGYFGPKANGFLRYYLI